MSPEAAFWIEKLKLQEHPEGGYFRELYRSDLVISKQHLPAGFHGDRNISTSIYFLLKSNQFSAFHRLASDELWHFYSGHGLNIYELDNFSGKLVKHRLGNDPVKGESFQTTIRAGNWFASGVVEGGEFALAGCTVSPGFHFDDFEMATRASLIAEYPEHADLITAYTR